MGIRAVEEPKRINSACVGFKFTSESGDSRGDKWVKENVQIILSIAYALQ